MPGLQLPDPVEYPGGPDIGLSTGPESRSRPDSRPAGLGHSHRPAPSQWPPPVAGGPALLRRGAAALMPGLQLPDPVECPGGPDIGLSTGPESRSRPDSHPAGLGHSHRPAPSQWPPPVAGGPALLPRGAAAPMPGLQLPDPVECPGGPDIGLSTGQCPGGPDIGLSTGPESRSRPD